MIKQIGRDRVLVELDDSAQQSEGGIHIPEASQSKSQYATVIMTGINVIEVEGGDRVYIPKYHGTEIENEGVTYKLFHQKDILAVITQ